jgi:hypothetical protein
MQICWQMPPFMARSRPVMRISPPKLGADVPGLPAFCKLRRKPRGCRCCLGPGHDWLSLCCTRHGRRTREASSSSRFLGRKVSLTAAVIVIAILREGMTTARMRRLREIVGVDRRTVECWRKWWAFCSPQHRSQVSRAAGALSLLSAATGGTYFVVSTCDVLIAGLWVS